MLIVDSLHVRKESEMIKPILIEPVVNLNLEIQVITEVSRSSRGNEELSLVFDKNVLVKLLVQSLVVFADNTEISLGNV